MKKKIEKAEKPFKKLKLEKIEKMEKKFIEVPEKEEAEPLPPIKKEIPDEKAKEAKSEVVLEKLSPGQKYFEAPDGTIIIGEADKQQVWYRKGDGGKGCFINPKR